MIWSHFVFILIGKILIDFIDFFNEQIDHMINFVSYLLDFPIILHSYRCFFQLRLWDFSTYHDQINKEQYFEEGLFLCWELSKCFKGDESLFSFEWFILALLYQLHRDSVPIKGNVIALKHNEVSILNVEFDVGDIFNRE